MNYLSKITTLIVMSILFLLSCKNNETEKDKRQEYPVVEVETRNIQIYETYPTSVLGTNNNDVRAKIPGYISEVLVDEGQRVHKGQIMFRLETNSLSQNASAAKAGVAVARAKVEAALVEVNKLQPLVSSEIVSAVLLETANVNLLQAQSELEQAKANHKSIIANVDYSVICAPIDGVVGKINWRLGALVGPADQISITTVSDIGKVYSYFSMNEAKYIDFLYEIAGNSIEEKLKNIPPVELVMANGKIYEEKGKVDIVTGQINPQTGSIQFRVSFANQKRILTNGNSGTIRIPKIYKNVLVIPETSTFEQQGKVFGFTVRNDTVKLIELKPISRINKLVMIENGLAKGDVVVAGGVSRLRTNSVIKPIKSNIDSIINKIQPIF